MSQQTRRVRQDAIWDVLSIDQKLHVRQRMELSYTLCFICFHDTLNSIFIAGRHNNRLKIRLRLK